MIQNTKNDITRGTVINFGLIMGFINRGVKRPAPLLLTNKTHEKMDTKNREKFNKYLAIFMALLALTVLVSISVTECKAQGFVEIFTNTISSEYDSVQAIPMQRGNPFAIFHYHRQDPLSSALALRRWQDRGGGTIPVGFYNGVQMQSLTDTAEYTRLERLTMPYSCAIQIDGNFIVQPNLLTLLNWDFTFTGGVDTDKIFVYIVTSPCWGPHYNAVMRMLGVDGHTYTDKLYVSTLFDSGWDVEKTKLIVTIENAQGRVIGCKQMSLRASITTSIFPELLPPTVKIWPNPVRGALNFSLEVAPQVLNISGDIVLTGTLGTRLDVSSLTPGLYFIKIGSTIQRIIKL